jgi:peroxiredoxin
MKIQNSLMLTGLLISLIAAASFIPSLINPSAAPLAPPAAPVAPPAASVAPSAAPVAPAAAPVAPVTTKVTPDSVVKMDARSEAILRKLANTYKSATSMSAHISADMELQSKDGVKQKLPSLYVVSIAKPNRFSVELISTRGGKVVSNGKRSEFYFKPANVYMIAPSLPTMMEDFDKHEFKFVTAGSLNLALTRELMEADPYSQILDGVRGVQYIGSDKVDGVDCDHLRMSRVDFDKDIWVEKGDVALLKKVQPDMTQGLTEKAKAAGIKMLLSFLYKDQVLNKSMNDGRFETAHEQGAKYVREFFHEEGAELIGKKAPDVTLNMSDGTKIRLSSLKDRLVVLDFWATWCPPCVMSLPIFAKASEPFKSKGVVFMAVNKGEDLKTAKSFFRQNKITCPLVIDDDKSTLVSAFNVEGIPCTVFIGRDGIVKGVHVGIRAEGLREGFIEDLNKFISGKSLKREE